MRLLIITSCTGQKVSKPDQQLTCDDFAIGEDHLRKREQELSSFSKPAGEMYTGQQHVRLMQGIDGTKTNLDIDLHIVSAGYGLIPAEQNIAPYECTFAGRNKKDLQQWGEKLGIPDAFKALVSKPYDLVLWLLGDDYLAACQVQKDISLGSPTLAFCGKATAKKLSGIDKLRTVTLSNPEAKRFSYGLVGLKGELTRLLLEKLSQQTDALGTLLDPETNILDWLDQSANKSLDGGRSKVKAEISTPNDVDWVIQLPGSWQHKPHRQKIRYFIPEWDDLVDNDFDFMTDTHSGGRGDWSNEVYAHQMYPEPNYDGILVSKVVAEKTKKKKERINEMGVHRYLRVPKEFPIIGDCGAFDYIMEDVPPYSTEEILDYYTRIGFDYGVSIDHLIVTATEEILDYYTRIGFDYGVSIDHLIVTATESQKKERYELTINNAEEFLKEHKKLGLPWTPIGAVQGWDPDSYAKAAEAYVKMGYTYIGLGGLVRSTTKNVLELLNKVHPVVPSHVDIHLFGLARTNALKQFSDLGVTSVDSASFLRRAWMGTGQNYLTPSGDLFAAIRIPEAAKSFRAKRIVSDGRATLEQVQKLEHACLKAMVDFDNGKLSVDKTVDILMEYDHLITPDREDNRDVLHKSLEAAPWKECECDICKKDGISVIIFRGNNRNRRRGFHNTYVFYRLFQQALNGEITSINRKSSAHNKQMDIFENMKKP